MGGDGEEEEEAAGMKGKESNERSVNGSKGEIYQVGLGSDLG